MADPHSTAEQGTPHKGDRSDPIDRMIARRRNPATVIRPRPISRFEPSPPSGLPAPGVAPLPQQNASLSQATRSLVDTLDATETRGTPPANRGAPSDQVPTPQVAGESTPLLQRQPSRPVTPEPMAFAEPPVQRRDLDPPSPPAPHDLSNPAIETASTQPTAERAGNRGTRPLTNVAAKGRPSTDAAEEDSRRVSAAGETIDRAPPPAITPRPQRFQEALSAEMAEPAPSTAPQGQTSTRPVPPMALAATEDHHSDEGRQIRIPHPDVTIVERVQPSPPEQPQAITERPQQDPAPDIGRTRPISPPQPPTDVAADGTPRRPRRLAPVLRPVEVIEPSGRLPETPQAPPTINVTIGRVEVRATPPPSPPAQERHDTRSSGPVIMSLETYLRHREERG